MDMSPDALMNVVQHRAVAIYKQYDGERRKCVSGKKVCSERVGSNTERSVGDGLYQGARAFVVSFWHVSKV